MSVLGAAVREVQARHVDAARGSVRSGTSATTKRGRGWRRFWWRRVMAVSEGRCRAIIRRSGRSAAPPGAHDLCHLGRPPLGGFSKAGSVPTSSTSRKAPPPVEIVATWSAMPCLAIAIACPAAGDGERVDAAIAPGDRLRCRGRGIELEHPTGPFRTIVPAACRAAAGQRRRRSRGLDVQDHLVGPDLGHRPHVAASAAKALAVTTSLGIGTARAARPSPRSPPCASSTSVGLGQALADRQARRRA